MNGSFAGTSPILSSDHADDALSHAVATMRPGWIALRGCVLGTGKAAPAHVCYALLHPQIGIALLDVVPGRTTPHAPDQLRRKLDDVAFGAEFGCTPPILYFCLPVRVLPDVGYLLEHEFSRQPASPLPRGEWVAAAQVILSAQPLPPAWQLAGRAGGQPPRRALREERPPRRFGGARLLAGFWGFATLAAGGGALFLQWLGPLETAEAAAPPLAAKANASGPAGADLRHTLIENDQAIRELQNRLKEPKPDLVANAVLTTAALPGAAAERGVDTAARAQELADTGEEVGTSHAQEAAIRQPPAQDSVARSAEVARAEAALRQIQADAEAAHKRLADTSAEVDRAGQQLAALQHQSEDTQTAGAAVGKQLTDAQAQLSQLEERRSAAEQQAAPAAQADRGRNDILDAGTRLAGAREPADRPAPHGGPAIGAAPSVAPSSLPGWAPDPASVALAEAMVRRGDALLQHGDVSAARLLYDRAASAGSAHAATAMGRTYDPAVLGGIGVLGLSPDPALAASWYRRGLRLGDEEARIWLLSLPPAASPAAARVERP